MYGIYGNSGTYAAYLVELYTIPSGPYCSKQTKSLVNVSLKLWSSNKNCNIISFTPHSKETISLTPRSGSEDARPTGDQEVSGSTPAGSATFFREDMFMNYFYGHSLPSTDSRNAVVSFWRKNVHKTS